MENQKDNNSLYSKMDYFLVAGGFILFFIFLYFIRETLSPVLLAASIFFVLIPVVRFRAVKTLLLLITFLFVIWLAAGMMSVFQYFVLGIVLAYLLNPLIDKLEKRMKRPIAAMIVLLAIFAILGTIVFLLLPRVVDSISQLYTPSTLKSIRNTLTNTIYPYVNQFGLDRADIRSFWETKLIPGIENMIGGVFSGLTNIGGIFIDLFKQILYIFILPFFIYYILVDWNKINLFVKGLFAPERQDKYDNYTKKIGNILNSYIRGLIVVAALNAVDVTILLYIFGHDYPVLTGVISGLFTFIPQFGIIISIAVNLIVALMGGNVSFIIPVTIIVLMGHNILEAAVINPKLVGKKINVHPALLIVSIFVFSYLFGFVGLFIAAPLTAILVSFGKEWREENRIIN
jgi:predicted PurR-regulated permease PerM